MLKLTLVYCLKKTNIILYDIHYTYLNVKMLEKCVFHLKIEINPDVNFDILRQGIIEYTEHLSNKSYLEIFRFNQGVANIY